MPQQKSDRNVSAKKRRSALLRSVKYEETLSVKGKANICCNWQTLLRIFTNIFLSNLKWSSTFLLKFFFTTL